MPLRSAASRRSVSVSASTPARVAATASAWALSRRCSAWAAASASVWAQTSTAATVTRVIDGDTAHMEQLAFGRTVTPVSDPTQDAVDRFGRSLFSVDRDDGLDIGQEMI